MKKNAVRASLGVILPYHLGKPAGIRMYGLCQKNETVDKRL
jgi:hypothetical protein